MSSAIPSTLQTLVQTTSHTSLFQAKDPVQTAYATEGTTKLVDASDYQRRDLLIQAHQEWKRRIDNVTRIVNGEWFRVWPDLTREPLAPTVANTIEMSITHFAAIGGAIIPSIKVPVAHAEGGPEGARGAAKRERRLRELEQQSNVSMLLSKWFADYNGAGAAAAFVWTDFTKPASERNPYIERVDPRHYYPVTDGMGNVIECLIARRVHGYETMRKYPELESVVNIDDADLEEWYWFEPHRIRHMIVDISPSGRKIKNGYVLVDEPNDLGIVPIIELVSPSFDGERRGSHDQTIHIMRVQHHLMALTIEHTEQEVYTPIGYYDTEGVETFGPGATMRYRSPDARVDRFQPQSHFDVKDLIGRLEEQARMQSVFPRQLTGDPGASIASARAIGAAQGALDARLALAHKQFEWFMGKVSSLLLRFDETYCDGDKTIYGDPHDRKKPEKFRPSRDIAGAYEVTRSYGLGAGSDPTNRETRLQMHLSSGLISRSRSREELDFLEDPLDEEKSIAKEMMMDAVSQGLIAASAQGDVEGALLYFRLLNDPNLTMEEVLIKFGEERQKMAEAQAQQAQGGGQSPLDVAAGAESLARGGIPGNAEGLPAGAALPALPDILAAPDTPRQVL